METRLETDADGSATLYVDDDPVAHIALKRDQTTIYLLDGEEMPYTWTLREVCRYALRSYD